MRFRTILLTLFTISAAFAQAPSATTPYSLTISAPITTTTAGKPVELQITLENTSHQELTIVKSRATTLGELTYDIAVVTTAGGPVVLTPYGRALHGQSTNPPIVIRSSPREVTLKPHEKVVDTVLLNKIYDLTPGSYIVRVRKVQATNDPGPNIVSNTVQLTILSN